MEPCVELIYKGYKEILFHHNMTGGALILVHYEENSHFRFKIVQCNEDDLFPLMVNNYTCYPQNLEVRPFVFGSPNQHNIRRMYQTSHPPCQLSQPILGILVMTTADLSNVHRRVEYALSKDHSGKHHRPHTPEASYSKALFGKQNASRNPPPKKNYRLPVKFSTSKADGVYVVEKVVRHYHLEQFALVCTSYLYFIQHVFFIF
ncbi:hypothetical protein PIB30_079755 [Stylosanthes scabra]|uniref:Uncharacterized protein n=1 Tax=Stylosanthes scabra TaxID=79078 RepID=A0ABU6UTU9_9FABA|nr:hypothetical protein [Stylosanthes scabra]